MWYVNCFGLVYFVSFVGVEGGNVIERSLMAK